MVIKLNNVFLHKIMSGVDHKASKFWVFLSMLLILGLSVLPLRGGWQLAPINQSSVYFSSDNFANQAALNGPWNLMYSLTRSANENENPFLEIPKQEADSLMKGLFASNASGDNLLNIDSTTTSNVIIVIWEGLTAKVIDSFKEGREITPHFNSLKNEGVYFSNMYGSGDRTDKGLVAVLSGYPSNPKESIVKSPLKAAKLPMLSKVFQKRNYHTSFFYGGETEFANMKAYLLQGGFDKIISVDDFEKKDLNSKWGAHDEVVMNRVVEEISVAPQPFFCTWLTLSSHEPFEVPSNPVFKGKDEESLYLNSLHYSDSVFGVFIQKLKSSPLWKNTVVLTVADHGSRMPEADFKSDDFRIGALVLGGLVKQPRIIARIGGQVDLAGMLMHEFKYKDVVFPWSRNLLDTTSLPWGFFSFNNGFGYAEPLGTVIYDNIGRRVVQKRGVVNGQQVKRGKTVQQSIYQDYLDK
jgi:phosphoglycerol transferase MdoB-like AlkP superfamily enzyme